jgi:hypothetical protein
LKFSFQQLIFMLKTVHLKLLFLLIIALLIGVTPGCKHATPVGHINQGVIEFDISYINTSGKNIPVQLLPKTMSLKFNKKYAVYTIEDRLGMFSISNIIDFGKHSHCTLVKIFDKKYVYRGKQTESSLLFSSTGKYFIEEQTDTLRLAGLLCNRAVVRDSAKHAQFDVFHTSMVDLNKPNYNTPFDKIDGLLLGFTLQLKSMDMQFRARKVSEKEIPDSAFEVPAEYKYINKKQMEDIVLSVLP